MPARLLRAWLKVRVWTAALALASVAAGLALTRPSPAFSRAILLFTLVYVVNGLIEFLHYFYRGIARSDVESTLTLWQRMAMLILALAALWWRADVTVLGVAMVIPAVATFWYSATARKTACDCGGLFEPLEPLESCAILSAA